MAKKYHFNININDVENNAGYKAIIDCKKILEDHGYQNIELHFIKKPSLIFYNLLKLVFLLIRYIFVIERGSLIVVQYPLKGVKNHFRFFIHLLRFKQCFVTCIIHDVDSLRYKLSSVAITNEIGNLNAYNSVITHNDMMTSWLKAHGLKVQTIEIIIFDYLYSAENTINENLVDSSFINKKVIFAGSLGRGKFIYSLHKIPGNILFELYGSFITKRNLNSTFNVQWKGSFSPDALIKNIRGGFGLIWDGDSIETCEGPIGDYLQYNNPHKLSLYIAAGIPVIVPHNAAVAKFVIDNNIGIVINSLADIRMKLNLMSYQQYQLMVLSTTVIKNKIQSGFFLKTALDQIERNHLISNSLDSNNENEKNTR